MSVGERGVIGETGPLPDPDYPGLPPLAQHHSLAEHVYQHLLSAISNLHIRPGEQLSEVRLAQQLGVSVTPVREALLHLAADGLVVRESKRRPRVALLSLREIEELYDVRGALESFAAAEATKHVTEEDLRRLAEIQKRGEQHALDGDIERYNVYHDELHETILDLARNDLLLRIMQPIRVKIRLCMYQTSMVPAQRFRGLKEHEELIGLLRARDASGIASLMRVHCEGGKRSYLECYAQADRDKGSGLSSRRMGRGSPPMSSTQPKSDRGDVSL